MSMEVSKDGFHGNSVDERVCNYGYLYYTGTMLRENKVLTSLELFNCGLGPEGLCAVLRAVGMNTTLTSLNLSCNKFDDQSIACLGKFFQYSVRNTGCTPALVQVHFPECRWVNPCEYHLKLDA